jgi:hypothetical protein
MEANVNMISVWVTIALALLVHVGSLIWFAATMKAKIEGLTTLVEKLESNLSKYITRQEFEREIKHIWTTINPTKKE